MDSFLKAQSVVVANDALASDHFQKTIMSMAIPDRITLRIVTLDEATCLGQDTELDNKRTLVIVSSIKDAYVLFSKGFHFSSSTSGTTKEVSLPGRYPTLSGSTLMTSR